MKLDLDEIERKARAATQGTWCWFGNTKTYSVYLATVEHGRQFVMDFVRWGMGEAQPRFQVDHRMVKLAELAAEDSPLGPKFEVPYRRDFIGIGHPDAEHIAAASPQVVLALIARIRELQAFIAETPNAGLQADKLHRHDVPELFAEDDGNAMYMDEAKRRILEKGAVLP